MGPHQFCFVSGTSNPAGTTHATPLIPGPVFSDKVPARHPTAEQAEATVTDLILVMGNKNHPHMREWAAEADTIEKYHPSGGG